MELTQQELLQIDEELQPLRDEKGILTLQKQFSWMVGKGAISLDKFGRPIICRVYENSKLLYEVLDDKLEEYKRWRKNGKRSLVGNFGIDGQTTPRQTNKRNAEERSDVSEDFSADVPF